MNTRLLSVLGMAILMASCTSTKNTKQDLAVSSPIETSIDLVNINEDRAPVIINPGRFTTKTVTYRLPRVIQGTYSVSDFGKYIDDFKAIDYKGNEMKINKVDTNTWTISNAKQLDKIAYLVNDTYDIEVTGGIGEETPFSPSAKNIESNNYVLNLHGL